MNSKQRGTGIRIRSVVALLVGAVILLAIVQMVGPKSATVAAITDSSPFITTYPIPTANSQPTNIIARGPGELWFTMTGTSAIGSLIVQPDGQYAFNQYPTPTANSAPYDLVYDGQYIWFTERQGNHIGRLNPDNGAIVEYPIPTAGSEPMGIAVTPDGNVWFVQRAGNKIARFTPGSGQFTEFLYPTPNALPEDVAAGGNDNIWFTAPGLNLAVQFFPSKAPSQQFEVVPVLDFGLQPWPPGSIAVLSSQPNHPWITAPTKDYVGRYAPGTLNYWRWITLAHRGTGVSGLFLQRSGDRVYTWFTEPGGNRAGVITTRVDGPLLGLYEQPLPGGNPSPSAITVDISGTAWIAAPGTNAILSWRSPYYYQGYAPAVAAQ